MSRIVDAHHVALPAAVLALGLCLVAPAAAQVLGEEAEMTRLQAKAEDAMASDDPDGAAMMAGRAALMAGQLGKKRTGVGAQIYHAREALLRSQEHAYRAMALFRRAGGQLPASSGVCGSLALAYASLRQAMALIPEAAQSPSSDGSTQTIPPLRESADSWGILIDATIADYQCR